MRSVALASTLKIQLTSYRKILCGPNAQSLLRLALSWKVHDLIILYFGRSAQKLSALKWPPIQRHWWKDYCLSCRWLFWCWTKWKSWVGGGGGLSISISQIVSYYVTIFRIDQNCQFRILLLLLLFNLPLPSCQFIRRNSSVLTKISTPEGSTPSFDFPP